MNGAIITNREIHGVIKIKFLVKITLLSEVFTR